MFDSEKASDYLWDPSVPFKPVNSGSGRSRANLEELNGMVDYMIPRVATVSRSDKPLSTELGMIVVLNL